MGGESYGAAMESARIFETICRKRSVNMKKAIGLMVMAAVALGVAASAEAAGKGIKEMTKDQLINLARSAAPESVSKDAAILIPGEGGKLVEVKKGTNGFTCIPDVDGQEIPDPICGDEASMQWINDMMGGKEKPANTVPGIAYMAKGGWHWEKDGRIIMDKNTPGAKRVEEPAHWMLFWPYEAKKSMIPSIPGSFGTYVMFDGSPYAHLMIYQDPNKIK